MLHVHDPKAEIIESFVESICQFMVKCGTSNENSSIILNSCLKAYLSVSSKKRLKNFLTIKHDRCFIYGLISSTDEGKLMICEKIVSMLNKFDILLFFAAVIPLATLNMNENSQIFAKLMQLYSSFIRERTKCLGNVTDEKMSCFKPENIVIYTVFIVVECFEDVVSLTENDENALNTFILRTIKSLATGSNYHTIYSILTNIESAAVCNEDKENGCHSASKTAEICRQIHSAMNSAVKKSEIALKKDQFKPMLPCKYFKWS